MIAAILLSQFNSTDDVIHVLHVFRTENSALQIYFLELHMEILMQLLFNNNQKICCWSKFLYVKNIS